LAEQKSIRGAINAPTNRQKWRH